VARLVVLREKIGEREFVAAVHRVDQARRGAPLSAAVIGDIIEIVTEVAVQVAEMN
jgi:hypothetical protein